MRSAEAARATACVGAARYLQKERSGAAQSASEPSGCASCAIRHAEVTMTASVRGGAVCLPDAIIPKILPGHGNRSLSGRPFSKVLLPLPAPCAKGSGCSAAWHLAVQGMTVVLHQICCNYEIDQKWRVGQPLLIAGSSGVSSRFRWSTRSTCILSTTLPAVHKGGASGERLNGA